MSVLIMPDKMGYVENCVSSGSGSSYLYGFFDQAWKEGMTKDEAEVCNFVCVCKCNNI